MRTFWKILSLSDDINVGYKYLVREKIFSVLIFVCVAGHVSSLCGYPGAPAHSSVQFSAGAADSSALEAGTIAEYNCDRGFELLGPARRVCGDNGTWAPQGIPFCGQ